MKKTVLYLLFLFIALNGNGEVQTKYCLYHYFDESNTNSKTLIPDGSLVSSYTIIDNNIEFGIGVRNDKIIFIGTNDKKFSVNGLKIGDVLSDEYITREIRKIPGWGYYVEIGSGWYAGFDFHERPDEKTPILFFFQYDFYPKKLYELGGIAPVEIKGEHGFKAFKEKFGVAIEILGCVQKYQHEWYEYNNTKVFEWLDSVYGEQWCADEWRQMLKHIAGFDEWEKNVKNRASIEVYLNENDFEGAKRDYNSLELINELYQYEPGDTIRSFWYTHIDAAKIPVTMRSTGIEYGIKYICSYKIKALAWIIMIYLDEPFENKFMVFSNSNNCIFDYNCCKFIDGRKDLYCSVYLPQAFFVKNESEGYTELMKEIGEWVELVNINGIDYVRKNGIAPLKTIKYEIIPFELINPYYPEYKKRTHPQQ